MTLGTASLTISGGSASTGGNVCPTADAGVAIAIIVGVVIGIVCLICLCCFGIYFCFGVSIFFCFKAANKPNVIYVETAKPV